MLPYHFMYFFLKFSYAYACSISFFCWNLETWWGLRNIASLVRTQRTHLSLLHEALCGGRGFTARFGAGSWNLTGSEEQLTALHQVKQIILVGCESQELGDFQKDTSGFFIQRFPGFFILFTGFFSWRDVRNPTRKVEAELHLSESNSTVTVG